MWVKKAGRPVAAQVGHQDPVPGRDQRRHHAVERPDVVRKPVQQDDGKPGGLPLFLVPDAQYRGLGTFDAGYISHRHPLTESLLSSTILTGFASTGCGLVGRRSPESLYREVPMWTAA